MMTRALQVLGLLALLGIQGGAVAAPPCCVPIKLDVRARTQTDEPTLTVKLTNVGQKPLRFSIGAGPWAGEGQISLVAIKLPLGLAIPNELRTMIDPPLGPMELKPAESREYDVPLRRLYPELADELKKSRDGEFVLFWTYQLTTWDSMQSERVGGWLPLKAR